MTSRIPFGWIALMLAASLVLACSEQSSAPGESATPEQSAPTLEEPFPSLSCLSAMARAAAEPTAVDGPQLLLLPTAHACPTADEWLTALRAHPGAMGLNERAQIGALDVQVMCQTSDSARQETPMCQDAYAQGIAEPLAER